MVLACPKLSRIGEASRICSVVRFEVLLLTAARYCRSSLVLSVLPEPDSPVMMIT